MNNDHLYLASEIRELESLIEGIPESNVIERMSLESRLSSIKAELDSLPQPDLMAEKACLTFRGKPVVGTHGIYADFAAKAAGAFSEAVAAIAAALSAGLSDMGPIPDREKNQLLITGTAVGSFGFEFELPKPEPTLFPEGSGSKAALERIELLFRLAAEGSDDQVAEVVEEVHPRAVRKVHEFLELLSQQKAWCGLRFAERKFFYRDLAQLEQSCKRLKEDNIHETVSRFHGKLVGMLPFSRNFELQAVEGEVIKGKIDSSIADLEELSRNWLHQSIEIKLQVIQVGNGRPRYTLMSLDDLRKKPETPE